MRKGKILVVEDDSDIREGVRILLESEEYEVIEAENGVVGLKLLDETIDLVILDIMMPKLNGLKVCEEIRKTSNVPVLFLTAKSQESDKLLGLMVGGDDYLAKPFSPRELVVRIKTILKRTTKSSEHNDEILKTKDLEIYVQRRIVKSMGQDIPLTIKEYEVLEFLMKNINLPLSREQIIESIWGYDYDGYDRNVDDTIKRLRKKLKTAKSRVVIKTVWGYGYRIDDNE